MNIIRLQKFALITAGVLFAGLAFAQPPQSNQVNPCLSLHNTQWNGIVNLALLKSQKDISTPFAINIRTVKRTNNPHTYSIAGNVSGGAQHANILFSDAACYYFPKNLRPVQFFFVYKHAGHEYQFIGYSRVDGSGIYIPQHASITQLVYAPIDQKVGIARNGDLSN